MTVVGHHDEDLRRRDGRRRRGDLGLLHHVVLYLVLRVATWGTFVEVLVFQESPALIVDGCKWISSRGISSFQNVHISLRIYTDKYGYYH